MDTLKARLNVAKSLLARARGDAELQALSQAQATTIISILQRHKLEFNQTSLADLQALSLDVGWHSSHRALVLSAFSPAPADRGAYTVRRGMQDYDSMLDFFTPNEWQRLADKEVSVQSKRFLVMKRLLALGLRCPKEPTAKLALSLTLFMSTSSDTLPHEDMKTHLSEWKASFKKLAAQQNEPLVYLTRLPPAPAELLAEAPLLYKSAYGVVPDHSPTPCVANAAEIRQLDATIRCRGHSTAHRLATIQAIASPQQDSSHSGMGFERLGHLFMQGMQQMQKQNMDMLMQVTQGRKRGEIDIEVQHNTKKQSIARGCDRQTPGTVDETLAQSGLQALCDAERNTDTHSDQRIADDSKAGTAPSTVEALLNGLCDKPATTAGKVAAGLDADTVSPPAKKPPAKAKPKASGGSSKAKRSISAARGASGGASKPSFSVEWTRSQVMCRTGKKGPGQSHRITFGSKSDDFPSLELAVAAARKWVATETKKGA